MNSDTKKKIVETLMNNNKDLAPNKFIVEAIVDNYVRDKKFSYLNTLKERNDLFIEEYFKMQEQNKIIVEPPNNGNHNSMSKEDEEVSRAIEASLQIANSNPHIYEPLTLEQRRRAKDVPIGLKNIGNTCYFNSFLQTLYRNYRFYSLIMDWKIEDIDPKFVAKPGVVLKFETNEDKILHASVRLVQEMQLLFGRLTCGNKKYADPSPVLNNIVDSSGQKISIGEQKDLSEFALILLERLADGLSHSKNGKMELIKQSSKMIPGASSLLPGGSNIDSCLKSTLKRASSMIGFSAIEDLFVDITSVLLQDSKQTNVIDDRIYMINLDIDPGELYSAWDGCFFAVVDDYKVEGQVVPLEKNTFIKSPPAVLSFCLSRVGMDKQTLKASKNNAHFYFPKEIFIDRFLLSKKEEYTQVRKQNILLQKELKHIEEYIKDQTEALENLKKTISFLQIQKKDLTHSQHHDSSLYVGPDKNLLSSIDTIDHYYKEIDNSLKKNLDLKKKLQENIEKSYEPFRTIGYYLQSIMIHDGNAEYGHYYSYIYENSKWYKFNDINVTEVDEDTVFKDAYGGYQSQASAYTLIYLSNDLFSKEKNEVLRRYDDIENEKKNPDYYWKTIENHYCLGQITVENMEFEKEFVQQKYETISSKVLARYRSVVEDALTETKCLEKDSKKKQFDPKLHSFQIYLRSEELAGKGNYHNNKFFINWSLLNGCLVSETKFEHNLLEIDKVPQLCETLKKNIKTLSSEHQINALSLNEKQSEIIQNKMHDYTEQVEQLYTVYHCFSSLEQNKINEYLKCSAEINEYYTKSSEKSHSITFYSKLVFDTTKVVLCELSLRLVKLIKEKEYSKYFENALILLAAGLLYTETQNHHFKFFKDLVVGWTAFVPEEHRKNNPKFQSVLSLLNEKMLPQNHEFKIFLKEKPSDYISFIETVHFNHNNLIYDVQNPLKDDIFKYQNYLNSFKEILSRHFKGGITIHAVLNKFEKDKKSYDNNAITNEIMQSNSDMRQVFEKPS